MNLYWLCELGAESKARFPLAAPFDGVKLRLSVKGVPTGQLKGIEAADMEVK